MWCARLATGPSLVAAWLGCLLLQKSVLGIVAGGRVVLAPGQQREWNVDERDKVAVLAAIW
jgi:hypothetical protein